MRRWRIQGTVDSHPLFPSLQLPGSGGDGLGRIFGSPIISIIIFGSGEAIQKQICKFDLNLKSHDFLLNLFL